MMEDSEMNDESTALLGSNPVSPPSNTRMRTSAGPSRSSRSGLFLHRFVIVLFLLILALMGGVGYMQFEIRSIEGQLEQKQSRLDNITAILRAHEVVIERFNSSVTEQDVLNRVQALEAGLMEEKKSVDKELTSVRTDVSRELNDTLLDLRTTVDNAKAEISNEVAKVKTDVDQYVRTTQDQFSMENSFMVYQLAGTFTVLSCLISMWHMTAHLRKLNQPDVQRKILAILWMCPIYAITSWFSLVFYSAEGWLAIIKDAWEAYIIYQFLSFCIAVLGKGDRAAVVDLLADHADHLTPPFRMTIICEAMGCFQPEPYESNRALADAILLQCQVFAMQFVFFRPLTTAGIVICDALNYYGLGDNASDYRSPQFYFVIIQNLSIFIAFAGLLKFYHAVDKELAWCRPLPKFLCIKGVVFMTFWQGLVIDVLASTTNLAGSGEEADSEAWAKSAQNFLICLEMLLFSIAHFYCFPTDEWEEGYRVKHSQANLADSIALGDFFSDLKLIMSANKVKKKKKAKKVPKEPTIPEGNEEDTVDADDDDADTWSAANSETSEDALGADDPGGLAKAISKKLIGISSAADSVDGDDDDDESSEVARARERLLASNILQSDSFEESAASINNAGNSKGSGLEQAKATATGATASVHSETMLLYQSHDSASHCPVAKSVCQDDDESGPWFADAGPSSPGGSQDSSMLRPSIFTTYS